MMRRRVPANGPGSSPLTPGKRQQLARRLEDQGLIPAHAGKTARSTRPHKRTMAHPRSRGENAPALVAARIARGSSPLTRGKPWAAIVDAWNAGIIPAHAGKTTFDASRCSRIRDHPRSRGENVIGTFVAGFQAGSSPLTRGKRLRTG